MHVLRQHQRARAVHSSRARDIPHARGYRRATKRHVSFSLVVPLKLGSDRPPVSLATRCTEKKYVFLPTCLIRLVSRKGLSILHRHAINRHMHNYHC